MPYLRLSSLRLDEPTKRHLADELTATVLDVLPDQKPEWTTVHFTTFEPTDLAIAGRLVSDGAVPDVHLELSAPALDERAWRALRNRLTDVLVEALDIDVAERAHVNVKLNQYDPHSFAIAGDPSDELPTPDAPSKPSSRKWLRPTVLFGFTLGALASYSWFTIRVGSDTTVDVADPTHSTPTDPGYNGTDAPLIATESRSTATESARTTSDSPFTATEGLLARAALVRHRNTIFQRNSQRLDLLNPFKTRTELIALLTDVIVTKDHPFEFTAIRSDHHDDSGLGLHSHARGYAADGWFLASPRAGDYLDATDLRFIAALRDAGADPSEYQIGLAGSAWTHTAADAAGTSVFQDSGADHIHIGAK